jgi:uncharacterized repeat protein (TIGR01451 family)
VQFIGTETAYRIRVANVGNAPAGKTAVTAIIPAGTKYVASQPSGRVNADGSKVTWQVDSLVAGGDSSLTLTCNPSAAGPARLDVHCAAENDLSASGSVTMQVEAMPDLMLAVDSPSRPVSLGGEAAYTVTLKNRGTASAENVEVVVYFSNGLEPIAAQGGTHRLSPGQVVFESIPAVAPGQSLALTVKAKADKTGNHVFRVEARAKVSGDRLVSEGTTRFFSEGPSAETQLARPSAPASGGLREEVRAADRRGDAIPAPAAASPAAADPASPGKAPWMR